MLSQPQNPVSYRLSHVRREAGAGLSEFCTPRKSCLPEDGQGAPERQLFLQVFYSSAHPGSPLSSAIASSGAGQAVHTSFFSLLWHCFLPVHTQVCTQIAGCSSSATGIQTAQPCSYFCPGKQTTSKNNCPAAIRNGKPKLNLSFITTLNPVYCWI